MLQLIVTRLPSIGEQSAIFGDTIIQEESKNTIVAKNYA